MKNIYDAIVVGGGVAGCRIASQIKGDVLLIEKSKKILPKDSGIVSTKFAELMPEAMHLVKHNIDNMDCVSPSGLAFSLKSTKPYAHILKRVAFSKLLLDMAKKNSDVSREMVDSVEYFDDHATVTTNQGKYETKIVIGCDGANSTVRRSMGIESPKLALGMMIKTPQHMEGDITVHFNKYFSPDFFSWIIPQNHEYGMMTSIRPKEYFDYFRKNLYLPPGQIFAYMIPYTYTKSYADRSILVGDACGQNKPLTGGGIVFSLMAARHAVTIVNDAIEHNRFGAEFLRYYEHYWKREIAWEIEKQFMVRSVYRNMSNNEVDDMFRSFGKHIESLEEFDYDKFSQSWTKMPKMKLLSAFVKFAPRLIF